MLGKRLPYPGTIAARRGVVPLLVGALLLLLALSLAACSGSAATTAPAAAGPADDASLAAAPPDAVSPPAGDGAPDFTGVDVVTGDTVSLSQYRGTTVLLNFVNYGCSSSLNKIVSDQLFAIRTLSDQRGDFVPVSVFCGCCPPDVLRNFAEENDLRWAWILDTDNTIVRQYYDQIAQYGYPTLVLIDSDQQVSEVAGYTDLDTLNAMIGELASY